MQSLRLAGKRCLIVGGTSGIGLATACRFLQEGAQVVIAGKNAETGEQACLQLQELGKVHYIRCDATDPQQVDELVSGTLQNLQGIDVLYHVAGISGRSHGDGPLHQCSFEGWQKTIEANLTSMFLTNRAVIQHMLNEQQTGVILNMSSVLSQSPSPVFFNTIAYTATKGAMISMSKLAAATYAKDGIRINVIAPGLIETPMAQRACTDQQILKYLQTKQPLTGNAGTPEQCADAAVYLCSDESKFVTGAVLVIDGGWSISEGQFPH